MYLSISVHHDFDMVNVFNELKRKHLQSSKWTRKRTTKGHDRTVNTREELVRFFFVSIFTMSLVINANTIQSNVMNSKMEKIAFFMLSVKVD